MEKNRTRHLVMIMTAVVTMAFTTSVFATDPELEMIGLSPATLEEFKGVDAALAEELPADGECTESEVEVCDEAAEAMAAEEAAWDEAEDESMVLMSRTCEPGMVLWSVRQALGTLLDGTAADLGGTADREEGDRGRWVE